MVLRNPKGFWAVPGWGLTPAGGAADEDPPHPPEGILLPLLEIFTENQRQSTREERTKTLRKRDKMAPKCLRLKVSSAF